MQPSEASSFSGPFGFTSSGHPGHSPSHSSAQLQHQGISADPHSNMGSHMRPFTAHGTGVGMASAVSNQYQHMIGGPPNPNTNPAAASSYSYLQSGGGQGGYDGLPIPSLHGMPQSSTRPITAHGTGQTVRYSSQSPFPTSSYGYSQATSYSDLSGPMGALHPPFSQNQSPISPPISIGSNPHMNFNINGMQKNYGASYSDVNYPSSSYDSSHLQSRGNQQEAGPGSQGGISQSSSQPQIGSYPLGHPALMQHRQYQDYVRSATASQQQQQMSSTPQQSRPNSRGGPGASVDEGASPFSHPPPTQARSGQSSSPQVGMASRGSYNAAGGLNLPRSTSSSETHSPSLVNEIMTTGAAEERKASSGNTFAGQKRKSFEFVSEIQVRMKRLRISFESKYSLSCPLFFFFCTIRTTLI